MKNNYGKLPITMVQYRCYPRGSQMFNFRETEFVPGFRVKEPVDEIPGFRLAPDGSIRQRSTDGSLDPHRGRWVSDYLLEANDRFAGNPYLGGSLASQAGQAGQYLSEGGSERWSYPSQVSSGNAPRHCLGEMSCSLCGPNCRKGTS